MEKLTNVELNTENAGAWSYQFKEEVPLFTIPMIEWNESLVSKKLTPLLARIDDVGDWDQLQIAMCTAKEWFSALGQRTQKLGYNPQTLVPHRGPKHDRHHTQVIQAVLKTSGLSMHGVTIELAELSSSGSPILNRGEINRVLDNLLRHLRLPERCAPQGWKLRRILAHLVIGHFGDESRNKILSTMLMWFLALRPSAKNLKKYTTADDASFDLLNQIIGDLGNYAQATELGIIVEGESGTIYEIIPIESAPYYTVACKLTEYGICLPPKGGLNLPLGDHLCGVVMALRNDISTSQRIDLLQMFLVFAGGVEEE